MSDENVGGLVELPDRVLAFLSQHGGWDAALAYVHKIEVENRLRANAVDRWVPCPDHRDKTERGKCYVCENESLQRKLSAHGQPVVDEAEVLLACAAYHGERWPGADSPFERQRMRAALIAALTGATT